MQNSLPQPSKRWIISPLIPRHINRELADFSALLRQLLYNRGIVDAKTAQAFIDGSSPTPTDPMQLKDMSKAVELLHAALENGDKIAVYGDYDVDGVTSCALLYEFLSKLGNPPRIYIPNRFDEGYGLNCEAIEALSAEGIQLLITVDCGIRSVEEVALAKSFGMLTILSDHHLPGEVLPDADAIINPHQVDDPYPYKDLAGVGLAFKLAEGYLEVHPHEQIDARQWLDFAAIGTVADLAPLNGENRSLVKQGLINMRTTQRQGLFSLAQAAGIKLEQVNAGNIGYGIGPRLNAAGRMDSAMAAFQLLVSEDLFEAAVLAQQLDNQNSQRRDITATIQNQAIEQALAADPKAPIIFAASSEFNEGVVGLAASKVVEALYRPAIIGHIDGDTIKASCRSIREFDITNALNQCDDLLVRYGGHSMAAGLTVKVDSASDLIERLTSLALKAFGDLDLQPELGIDYEISLDKLRPEHIPGIFEDVEKIEPTGRENPEALFCSRNCKVSYARCVGDGQHLKLGIKADNVEYDAIAFNQGYWLEQLPELIDIAYVFEINNYMGRQTLQLRIKDIRPSQAV